MDREPVLSILIPTYNRRARVKALIDFLIPFLREFEGKVELVVSNNSSTDGTDELVYASPYLSFLNREIHLRTAEEHVFEAISLCRGKFVWCHGDDDIPNLDTLRFAVDFLEADKVDFVVFNSMFLNANGIPTGSSFFRMASETLTVDFANGACSLGLTSGLAGFTTSIQRLSILRGTDWRPILAKTPIYSHVAWWLIAFKGRKMTFVNKPICGYRDADPVLSGDHFARFAETHSKADFHFWTTGLVELLQFVEDNGALRTENIAEAFEIRGDGSNFRLLDNIVNLIFLQIVRGIETNNPRNNLSSDEFDLIANWVLRIDPGYFECVALMRSASMVNTKHLIKGDAKPIFKLSEDFSKLLAQRAQAASLYCGFIGRQHGFSMYRHLSGFVGFADEANLDRSRLLRSFDIDAVPNLVLTASTMPDLQKEVSAARHSLSATSSQDMRMLPEMSSQESKVAQAIYAHAQAVFDASRFTHVTMARRMARRVRRLAGIILRRLGIRQRKRA